MDASALRGVAARVALARAARVRAGGADARATRAAALPGGLHGLLGGAQHEQPRVPRAEPGGGLLSAVDTDRDPAGAARPG
eukprot:scaffold41014_cov69-Phaeocystis_antarctica.AAC.2